MKMTLVEDDCEVGDSREKQLLRGNQRQSEKC